MTVTEKKKYLQELLGDEYKVTNWIDNQHFYPDFVYVEKNGVEITLKIEKEPDSIMKEILRLHAGLIDGAFDV